MCIYMDASLFQYILGHPGASLRQVAVVHDLLRELFASESLLEDCLTRIDSPVAPLVRFRSQDSDEVCVAVAPRIRALGEALGERLGDAEAVQVVLDTCFERDGFHITEAAAVRLTRGSKMTETQARACLTRLVLRGWLRRRGGEYGPGDVLLAEMQEALVERYGQAPGGAVVVCGACNGVVTVGVFCSRFLDCGRGFHNGCMQRWRATREEEGKCRCGGVFPVGPDASQEGASHPTASPAVSTLSEPATSL